MRSWKLEAWSLDKKLNALKTEGKIGKEKVTLILPQGFMNNSGRSLKPIISSAKGAEQMIVIHDDLDLPLGRFKIMFDRGAGGHRGVESIIKNLKTQKFTRIKVGISPVTPSGKIKKPEEKKVVDFIIGDFKDKELAEIKKEAKKIVAAIEMMISESRDKAMSLFNNQ